MFAVLQLGRPKLRERPSVLVEEEEPHGIGRTEAVHHRKGAERVGRGQLSPLCLSCAGTVSCAARGGQGSVSAGSVSAGSVLGRYMYRVGISAGFGWYLLAGRDSP